MSEMIDRLARAIFIFRCNTREQQAIAVLKALREPTEHMRAVGADVAGNSQDGATVIWQAMVDAALSSSHRAENNEQERQ